MKEWSTVLNATEQGKRLKSQKRLRRFIKREKEKAVSMAHSPLKSGYERKERNMTVARRDSAFKLKFFLRRERTLYV